MVTLATACGATDGIALAVAVADFEAELLLDDPVTTIDGVEAPDDAEGDEPVDGDAVQPTSAKVIARDVEASPAKVLEMLMLMRRTIVVVTRGDSAGDERIIRTPCV